MLQLQYVPLRSNTQKAQAARMSVNPDTPSRTALLEVLFAPINGVLGLFSSTCRYSQRMTRLDYLSRLTDEQLARRGLRRDDIVRHVYRGGARG